MINILQKKYSGSQNTTYRSWRDRAQRLQRGRIGFVKLEFTTRHRHSLAMCKNQPAPFCGLFSVPRSQPSARSHMRDLKQDPPLDWQIATTKLVLHTRFDFSFPVALSFWNSSASRLFGRSDNRYTASRDGLPTTKPTQNHLLRPFRTGLTRVGTVLCSKTRGEVDQSVLLTTAPV